MRLLRLSTQRPARLGSILLLGLASTAATTLSAAEGVAPSGHVNVIELDNRIISPITQAYIEHALQRSATEGARGLVIILDTPGGLLESTRGIVKAIMNARVPVAVYVAPAGSRAGSAGVFITLAAHVAAMAPSTNIGAAHPVNAGGEGSPARRLIRRIKRATEEEEVIEEAGPDPMADKILNDTVAWAAALAKTRGRNEDWARKAVTESISATEREALDAHIVDLIAVSLEDLLQQMDGRRVDVAGQPVTLQTAHSAVVRLPMSKREEFLATITHPNIAYLLMMLGTLGLIFEFTHPGIGFPGIAGLICLLLALYAFQALPLSYAGAALVLIGLVLLVAELMVVSYGLLGLGGVIALTLGSLMLVESPDPALRISWHVVAPTVGTVAAFFFFVGQRALRAHTQRVTTGAEGLVGAVGSATTDLQPEGTIFVHGESWSATASTPVKRGAAVRVTRVEGLHLWVAPAAPHATKKGTR
jgi:membrane-bound serine protease (ClpP class)